MMRDGKAVAVEVAGEAKGFQPMVETQEWEAEVVDLKLKGLGTQEIAEALGKHPATIRKAVARARDAGALRDDRVLSSDEAAETFQGGETPGNNWINAPGSDVPREDDPEHTEDDGDPLANFKAQAGEAVGPMPPGPAVDTEPVVESRVAGTRQMAIDFGEEAPPVVEATLKFSSDKHPSGFFGLGDEIRGSFVATVTKAPGKLKWDKDIGGWVSAPTDYVATIEEFTVDVGGGE